MASTKKQLFYDTRSCKKCCKTKLSTGVSANAVVTAGNYVILECYICLHADETINGSFDETIDIE